MGNHGSVQRLQVVSVSGSNTLRVPPQVLAEVVTFASFLQAPCLSYGNSVLFCLKCTVVTFVPSNAFPDGVISRKKPLKPLNETSRCQENMEHLKGKPSKWANYSWVTIGISRWGDESSGCVLACTGLKVWVTCQGLFFIKSTSFSKEEVLGNSLIRLLLELVL